MISKQQIDSIIIPTIEGLGYECVLCEVVNHGSGQSTGKKSSTQLHSILKIFLDRLDSKPVTLDDCQLVNRHLNKVLAVELGEASSSIGIEVSSPGFDRPLVKIEHFAKYIGSKVKVRVNTPIMHEDTGIMQRNIVGYIKEVINDDDNKKIAISHIDSDDIVYSIDINNIIKANLVPEWEQVSNKR